MSRKGGDDGLNVIATNRKARHEYEIIDVYEAGIALVGTEVKSLREGKCVLAGAFARLESGEVYLEGAEIPEYSHGNLQNHAPKRPRKLLLNRIEIKKIEGRVTERGCTLVPLRMYFKGGRAKLELAVAKGRKLHDRREANAKKEAEREIARAVGRRGARGGRR